MWTLCAVLFTLFSDEGVDRHFLRFHQANIVVRSQGRFIMRLQVEQISQRRKWMRTEWNQSSGKVWARSPVRAERRQRKSSSSGFLRADGDSDQRREIRRWYRLKVKIDLIWNNSRFKDEADCLQSRRTQSILRYEPRADVWSRDHYSKQRDGSQVTLQSCCTLFGLHTHTGCPQDWLTVCLLHFSDIFTTQRINTT